MCRIRIQVTKILKELRHGLRNLKSLASVFKSVLIFSNLCHPSSLVKSLSLSLWCFSILLNYYFQVSYHVQVILYVAKIIKMPWLSSFNDSLSYENYLDQLKLIFQLITSFNYYSHKYGIPMKAWKLLLKVYFTLLSGPN